MPLVPRQLTEHTIRRVIRHYDNTAFAEAATQGVRLRRGKATARWLDDVPAFRPPPGASAKLRQCLQIVELALVADYAMTLLRENLNALRNESQTQTSKS